MLKETNFSTVIIQPNTTNSCTIIFMTVTFSVQMPKHETWSEVWMLEHIITADASLVQTVGTEHYPMYKNWEKLMGSKVQLGRQAGEPNQVMKWETNDTTRHKWRCPCTFLSKTYALTFSYTHSSPLKSLVRLKKERCQRVDVVIISSVVFKRIPT